MGKAGPRIHISRYGLYDTNKYNIADVVKVGTMLGEIQFREDDNAMVNGFVEVIDLKGVGAGHIFQFDAVLVKKLAVLGDKAWPYRPKGFHFVNAPTGTEKILSIAKSLMSEKIKQRVSIENNVSFILKIIIFLCSSTFIPNMKHYTILYRKTVCQPNMVATMAPSRMSLIPGKRNCWNTNPILRKRYNTAPMKSSDLADLSTQNHYLESRARLEN